MLKLRLLEARLRKPKKRKFRTHFKKNDLKEKQNYTLNFNLKQKYKYRHMHMTA